MLDPSLATTEQPLSHSELDQQLGRADNNTCLIVFLQKKTKEIMFFSFWKFLTTNNISQGRSQAGPKGRNLEVGPSF